MQKNMLNFYLLQFPIQTHLLKYNSRVKCQVDNEQTLYSATPPHFFLGGWGGGGGAFAYIMAIILCTFCHSSSAI